MRRDKGFLSALLVLALLVTAASLVQAPRDKKTLNPTADSFVRSDFPDWNSGRGWLLWVEEGFQDSFSFLMFDLAEIPSVATIEQAKLRLHTTGDTSPKAPVSVYYCPSNDWTEMEITYNNKPAFSPDLIDTANVTTPMTWYEWNVTATAKSTFEADGKRLSLVLKADTYGLVEFSSRNDPLARPPTEWRPQLVVLYEAPPPSGTNPALTALILIGAIGAAAVGLGLTYVLLKRRKPSSPQPPLSLKENRKQTNFDFRILHLSLALLNNTYLITCADFCVFL